MAAAVKKARKGLGLSQEDLALEAGLDRTYISQVERGTRNSHRCSGPLGSCTEDDP